MITTRLMLLNYAPSISTMLAGLPDVANDNGEQE